MKALDSPKIAGQRLRQARVAAGFATAADAARELGIKEVTVRAHENGQNGLSSRMLDVYGRAYGVTPQYLLFGQQMDGDPVPPQAPHPPPTAYEELAAELASVKGDLTRNTAKLAYLKDGLRKLLEGLG